MAEAALISAAASGAAENIDPKAITEAIKTGVEIGVKIAREAERVEAKLQEILERANPGYDYEKVAVRSLYGTSIFCMGWLGVKIGQFMIGLTNFLNNIPLLGLVISDEAVEGMNQVGDILNIIDEKFMMPYGPAMPVAITGASAFIEYLRIREDLPLKQRKVSDAAIGLSALGVLYAVNEGMQKSAPPPLDTPEGTVTAEWTCPFCGAIFATRIELFKHELDAHPGEQPPPLVPKWKCPSCPAAFTTQSALTAHIRDVHRRL